MSFRRRAAAPRLIDWTGERCVPWTPDVQVVYEHFHRYLWASRFVAGKRVLDLGSGEGFGAAILAETATQVVGIDVDERTVEHSRLNYASTNLDFKVATATDLSTYDSGAFDVVVAFEIIEHVADQDRVMSEIARLLTDDGVLAVSTPDRQVYSALEGRQNPFHVRELTRDELLDLLSAHFSDIALWGQRTVTGSHLRAIADPALTRDPADQDFFIDRVGDEWREAGDPIDLYIVALAAKAALPAVPGSSTLADCGLQLMRIKERDAVHATAERDAAERERQMLAADLERKDEAWQTRLDGIQADLACAQRTILDLRTQTIALDSELSAARNLNRRTEESVTWQAFQRTRCKLYRAIGEESMLARGLRLSLRAAGRLMVKRSLAREASDRHDEGIRFPTCDHPTVSLIIPVYAHAALTEACLRSIADYTAPIAYEVIVVDDAADAKTKQLLAAATGLKVIHNKENLGYLRSVNRGAKAARGGWIVLFNNDTEVRPGWLSAMLSCAESSDDIGIVTPKFVYPDGSLNEAGGIIWRDGTGVNYGRGDDPCRFHYEYRRETDYGSAAALMVRSDFWKAAGGFDERYLPMYYEDTDLCFQAREHGLKVLYEPEAVVVHVEGATSGADEGSSYKRYQAQNRPRFVEKWRHRLEREQLEPAPSAVRAAANRHRDPHVLIVDYRVPTWDRDSGSLRMLGMMQALLDLGARVSFMPDNFVPLQPYTRHLQRMGIEVLCGDLDVNAELTAICPSLSAAILCRPTVASRWLDSVRELSKWATVAYDTVDLHWLRETRRSATALPADKTSDDGAVIDVNAIPPKAKALRQIELAMMRASDVTIVVSENERLHVENDVPGADVLVVPNVHDVATRVNPAEHRSGVVFVGGFAHNPNIDAAIRLVRDIMPIVWRELGNVKVSIIGSDAPPEVRSLVSPLVSVAGWVEDLQPVLDQARVMVAPLSYGAGVKGKVTQSLAAGLPVVTTKIGAEGIEADNCLLVADGPYELAQHVIRVYRDDDLWRQLSAAGQAIVAERFSRDVITERMRGLLRNDTRGAESIDLSAPAEHEHIS